MTVQYSNGEVGQLISQIKNEVEWLETTEGDEVECISIENLQEILTNFLNTPIKLTENGK